MQKELDSLLNLLLKADRDTELATQRERIRAYLKEVGRILRVERDLRGRTEGSDDAKLLAQSQQRLADDTGKLGENIDKNEHEDDPKRKESADGDAKQGDANQGDANKGDSKRGEPNKSDSDGKQPDAKEPDGKQPDANKGAPDKGDPSKGQPAGGDASKGQPSERDSNQGDSGKSQPGQNPPGQQGGPSQGGGDNQDQQPQQPERPADRVTERLRAAQQQMEQARKKLEESEKKGATEEQQKAIEALEQAKAELERVLHQIREEEMERTLTQLAARFRRMLEVQTAVYEGTVRLDRVTAAQRGHNEEIESARLSREEASLAGEADKALLLLREEGSSVAFPEIVEQMRDDMQQITKRLAAVDTGSVTQGLENDVLAALEETIAALEKEIKNLEKNRTPPGQSPGGGEPAEPPLVEKLAELKMIRSLQVRINTRTKRYGEMIAGEDADTPELLEALDQLAKRQERVYQATIDLNQGKND